MSAWQFAAREGYLKWTSPNMPDGGEELYSVLSPTLLLGYQQQGDVLPLDYVKMSSIRNVSQLSPFAVQLTRDAASPLVLVCPTETEARAWLQTLRMAKEQADVAPSAPGGSAPPAIQRDPPPSLQPPLKPQVQQRTTDSWLQDSFQKFSSIVEGSKQRSRPLLDEQDPGGSQQRSQPLVDANAFLKTDASATSRPLVDPREAGSNLGVTANQATTTTDSYAENKRSATTTTTTLREDRIYHSSSGQSTPATKSPVPAATASSRPLPFSDRYQSLGTPSAPAPLASEIPLRSTSKPMTDPSFAATAFGPSASTASQRRGMFVSLPANPDANRNVKPNVSAIWKEYIGPDGHFYAFHEPTQTLLRRLQGSNEFETLVAGTGDIPAEDMDMHPMFTGAETSVDLNTNLIHNVHNYSRDGALVGGAGTGPIPAPTNQLVASPRGQYSPSRRAGMNPIATGTPQQGYHGRRVHHLTLAPDDEQVTKSVIEHQVQTLGGQGLVWDPRTNAVTNLSGSAQGDVGMSTLQKQWEHVRRILMQGRYFKKHAIRTVSSSFRYVFLTSDNSYVVCVPTSQVHMNVHSDPMKFGSVADTIQYYGPSSRAIALNTITHISLGTEEEFVRRRKGIDAECAFCIVSKTHAFVLECNSPEEARYFCDAWTFFLYHSRPINYKKNRTPNVVAPVTHGTRSGVAF